MTLIFCIDDKNGMMFFGKRQSQDRLLREWIINHTAGSRLWMSTYSAKQFRDLKGYTADDDYPAKAAEGDYCFVEDKGYSLENAAQIILCHWNRRYQADKVFDIDLKANGFRKCDSLDIIGSSHDKITIETYRKGLR